MASHKPTLVKCSGITLTENCKITHSGFVKDITKEPQKQTTIERSYQVLFLKKIGI